MVGADARSGTDLEMSRKKNAHASIMQEFKELRQQLKFIRRELVSKAGAKVDKQQRCSEPGEAAGSHSKQCKRTPE